MKTKYFSADFYKMLLSDEHGEPTYTCPSCKQKGYAFDHVHPDPFRGGNEMESCQVCGFPSLMFRSKEQAVFWRKSWKENGSKTISDMPLPERIAYVDMLYDCEFRKEYVIPSDDDIKNKRLDKRIFTDNKRTLKFVKDDSNLTITNDKGEKWEFPYETNRIFELDSDKRYVMLIEECGYARLLASDYLAVRPSVRLNYPGLTPEFFGFVDVFSPDCIFEDRSGVVYTATVRKGKGEIVFEDDEFHKKVVSLCGRIKDFINTLPPNDRRRGIHQYIFYELESMDRRGDPSRHMPQNLISILNQEKSILPKKRFLSDELVEELSEMVREYKALKRV